MSTIPTSFDNGPCLDEVFLLDVNQFMCELWSSPGLLKIPTTLFSFVFFPSFFQVFLSLFGILVIDLPQLKCVYESCTRVGTLAQHEPFVEYVNLYFFSVNPQKIA